MGRGDDKGDFGKESQKLMFHSGEWRVEKEVNDLFVQSSVNSSCPPFSFELG